MKRVLDCMIDQRVDAICILANFSEQFLLADDERATLMRLCLSGMSGGNWLNLISSRYRAQHSSPTPPSDQEVALWHSAPNLCPHSSSSSETQVQICVDSLQVMVVSARGSSGPVRAARSRIGTFTRSP